MSEDEAYAIGVADDDEAAVEVPDLNSQEATEEVGYFHEDWPGYEWAQATTQTPAEVLQEWEGFKKLAIEHNFDDDVLLMGVEKVYSTSEAARFFGRSNQWLYYCLRHEVFTYKDGRAIQPERVAPLGKRRFTLPIIREIALSCHRRGNLRIEDLHVIMAKILLAEFGEKVFANVDAAVS
jgi:hypothetical protein